MPISSDLGWRYFYLTLFAHSIYYILESDIVFINSVIRVSPAA